MFRVWREIAAIEGSEVGLDGIAARPGRTALFRVAGLAARQSGKDLPDRGISREGQG